MRQIILASQSKARKLIFDSLGIPFTTCPAYIDEKVIRDTVLGRRAEAIASAKAKVIIKKYPDAIVIAADTFSESHGKVFEKPASVDEAKKMLEELSGKEAINYTGFCYIDLKNNIEFSTVVISNYTIRILYENEIKQYVEKYPVTQWAAGFALVEPYILTIVGKINGSYTGFSHGLPMEILIPLLKKSGFEPNPSKGMVQ